MTESNDSVIVDIINSKIEENINYWDFSNIVKKDGIHSYAKYPATMVPEMQRELLEIISSNIEVTNVLDPFMGSGTVLVEGMKNNLDVYGMDINPYAYLLTKSKLTIYQLDKLKRAVSNLERNLKKDLKSGEVNLHDFYNADKWFRDDIHTRLSFIRNRVLRVKNTDIRLFFLIAFSDVVTQVKNSQSSTFKLHIKSKEKIDSFNKDALDLFFEKVHSNVREYEKLLNELESRNILENKMCKISRNISCDDSRNLINKLGLEKESIDLVLTSPPYGDNQTTVTYGQFSMLPLHWIYHKSLDKEINSELMDNYSKIDSSSLGGRKYTEEYIFNSGILSKSAYLNDFYNKMISYERKDKARKVASFIIDFDEVLNQLEFVLKTNAYLVFVVGNRRVHNELVLFDKIIEELLRYRFEKVVDFNRLIKNKKVAANISKVGDGPVKSINQETILFFKKIEAMD